MDITPLIDEPTCWTRPVTAADLVAARQCTRHTAHLVLWNWQHGRCAVCGKLMQMVRDHDHATGFLRGLLCMGCNSFEGNLEHAICGMSWARREANLIDVMAMYRKVNPASRIGLRARYATAYSVRSYRLPRRWEGPVPVA